MTDLKGFSNVHSVTLSTEIEDTLVEYFDWGLLNKGNYFNVSLGDTSPSGTDLSKLRMTEIASETELGMAKWNHLIPLTYCRYK
jgi:hypothetical protein